MSQDNVEIVREGYEAFARGDLDAVLVGGGVANDPMSQRLERPRRDG